MKPAKPMDSKETLQEKAEARLEGLKAQIEEIRAEIKARNWNESILDELGRKQEKADERLWVFKSASGESWRVFVADMDEALNALENTVDETKERMEHV